MGPLRHAAAEQTVKKTDFCEICGKF